MSADANHDFDLPEEMQQLQPMLLQRSLLPKPSNDPAVILPPDQAIARLLIYHLGDFEWTSRHLDPIQQKVYDHAAYLITSLPGPRARVYTLLALLTLDLHSIDQSYIDLDTQRNAAALQLVRRQLESDDLELEDLSWDDLGQLVGEMAMSCGIEIDNPQDALDELLETISQMMAEARAQGEFMDNWFAAFFGSARIDPKELSQLWERASTESERAHIANEYGFESIESCADTITRYRLAMMNIIQRLAQRRQ